VIERKIKNMNYWIAEFKADGTPDDLIAKIEADRDEWQSYIDFADAKEGK